MNICAKFQLSSWSRSGRKVSVGGGGGGGVVCTVIFMSNPTVVLCWVGVLTKNIKISWPDFILRYWPTETFLVLCNESKNSYIVFYISLGLDISIHNTIVAAKV